MIVEYIRYKIGEEDREGFIKAVGEASQYLDKSEHCLGHELTHCDEDPANFIWRIEWTSKEDHLQVFRKSADFRPFLTSVRAYFSKAEEMYHYTPIKFD